MKKWLAGKKTYLVVLALISIVIHMIYTELLQPEWGLLFIAGSLLPLTINAGNARRHAELKEHLKTTGNVPSVKEQQKTQWDK